MQITSKEQPGSPKFLTTPFVIMPRTQTPGSSTELAVSLNTLLSSSIWTLSTLPTLVGFGAQYLHLRCSLITPIHQLHTVGCPRACGFGFRLLAKLCLIRTFTGKTCQAFLGAPIIRNLRFFRRQFAKTPLFHIY